MPKHCPLRASAHVVSLLLMFIAIASILPIPQAKAAGKTDTITYLMETVCHVEGDGYCEKRIFAMPVRFGNCTVMRAFGLDKLNANKLLVGTDGKVGRVYTEECFESSVVPKGADMGQYPGPAR